MDEKIMEMINKVYVVSLYLLASLNVILIFIEQNIHILKFVMFMNFLALIASAGVIWGENDD